MIWGELISIGGSDLTNEIPKNIVIKEKQFSLGRIEENTLLNLNITSLSSQGNNSNDYISSNYSHFVINKPYISGKHFIIIKINENNYTFFNITDCSSNGTYINNNLIGKGKTIQLHSNDQISLKFRNNDKIIFQFNIIDGIENNFEPPTKYQRSSLNKRIHSSISNNCNNINGNNNGIIDNGSNNNYDDQTLTKRINSLEKENQQQEIRISSYVTKLESSAREIANLQANYQTIRESLQEKENQLNESKQNNLILESSLAAMEARCHNLDDTILNMKTQLEFQRDQLRLSEERSSMATELQMKLENVNDELSYKKTQLESMNQMYEEVNISYQREKRNRENIEEEYKRIQHIIKTNEENKIQLFTNYENMKKEIQLYQDLNRSNEEKILKMSQLLSKLKKEWLKERVYWNRTYDNLFSTIHLVYEKVQETKKNNNNNHSNQIDLDKELEEYISISPTDVILSLSQKPLISQSTKLQNLNILNDKNNEHLISNINYSGNTTISINSSISTTSLINNSSPNIALFTQLPDESNFSNHSKCSNEIKTSQLNIHNNNVNNNSNNTNNNNNDYDVDENKSIFLVKSSLITQSANDDSFNCDHEIENTIRFTNTLSTLPTSSSFQRHGIIYDTLQTMITQPIPEINYQNNVKNINDINNNDAMLVVEQECEIEDDRLSPTIQSSSGSLKFSSTNHLSSHGILCDEISNSNISHNSNIGENNSNMDSNKIDNNGNVNVNVNVNGDKSLYSTNLTSSRRIGSILSGWIDDSLTINKTPIKISSDPPPPLSNAIDIKENQETDDHQYDVIDDDDEDDFNNINKKNKKQNDSRNDGDRSVGGLLSELR